MKLLIPFLIVLLIGGCSPVKVVEIKDEIGEVVERYQIDKKTGQKQGLYERLNEKMVTETASYQNDTLDGVRILYNRDDGQKEIEEHYKMGVFHGPYLTYHPDGTIKSEGQYENGTMEGAWKRYYLNGQLMETVTMHNNQEDGPFIEYWETGKIKAEGSYIDGDNEQGELKLYNEEGILEKIMSCDRGICHTTWKKEMLESQ
ncbi:MAG: toxin-antitoxin system YwqK family antitoxin [Saprospiraceae bacterium]|nr:toxin-antitoxin system YwqK family antitoxin [Saprospiraceae bacterium]